MNLSPPHPDSGVHRRSRWRRWTFPTALLAAAPKCVLCLLAYTGLGAALGLGGREMCGAPDYSSGQWAAMLLLLGGSVVIGVLTFRSFRA